MGLKIENSNFQYIYKQYDGPLYIIPAKTFYNPKEIIKLNKDSSIPQDPKYFAAHLPLYPLLIRLISPIFGYLKAMLGINLIFSAVLASLFYFILKQFKITQNPLLLSTIFLFLPRFLVIRTTGAPESLFIVCILASLYFFEKEKYFVASLLGSLAVMTKIPGILLFVAYGLTFIEKVFKSKKIQMSWFWVLLIPLGLTAVFCLYYMQYNDFFAFWHTKASVPMPYPFSSLNFQAKWIGTAWLEDILLYFFMYGATVFFLKDSKYRSFFYFTLVFFTATLFVQHRDISRYSLPIWPMACIAFEQFLTSSKLRPVILLLLSGIFLYAWGFLIYNVMPITEWLPFL